MRLRTPGGAEFRLICNTPDFIIPIEGAGPKLRHEHMYYRGIKHVFSKYKKGEAGGARGVGSPGQRQRAGMATRNRDKNWVLTAFMYKYKIFLSKGGLVSPPNMSKQSVST